MGLKEIVQKGKALLSRRQEVELHTPNVVHVDKTYEALLRQKDYYEKKHAIPRLQKEIKVLEKETFGDNLTTDDAHNIMKTPNHFNETSVYDDLNYGSIYRGEVRARTKPKMEFDYESATPQQRRAEGKESRRALIQAREGMAKARQKQIKQRREKQAQFEKSRVKIQRDIARGLRSIRLPRGQQMTSQEYRRMYQQSYNAPRSGGILNAENMFDPRRYNTVSRGNASILSNDGILNAPNLVLQSRQSVRSSTRKNDVIRWF